MTTKKILIYSFIRWFQIGISYEESKNLLQHQLPGTFLVRMSGTKSGTFVLDYVREIGAIRCVALIPTEKGLYPS